MAEPAFFSPPPDGKEDGELFQHLVASNPPKPRGGFGWGASLTTHGALIGLVVLVPLFWPAPLPETPKYIRALIYDPPPPPPPPPPRGSAMVPEPKPARPVSLEPEPTPEPKLVAELEVPKEAELLPEPGEPEDMQAGDPTGSEFGIAEGMPGGVVGGQVGGVLGGVLGGVVGGTGTGPVMDYDRAPRPIRITRPQYPQEAFVKKIEGTVVVEILIDTEGRVVQARVIQSIPLLDQAAIDCVYQWRFQPAIKDGRPVPTVANAPVGFRIF
jgi:protein TonB